MTPRIANSRRHGPTSDEPGGDVRWQETSVGQVPISRRRPTERGGRASLLECGGAGSVDGQRTAIPAAPAVEFGSATGELGNSVTPLPLVANAATAPIR